MALTEVRGHGRTAAANTIVANARTGEVGDDAL